MPLQRSSRAEPAPAAGKQFTPVIELPAGCEDYRPTLAPNVGATQDVAALLKGSRDTPSVVAVATDNTPSTLPYRKARDQARKKAHQALSTGKHFSAVYVLEQPCGLPLGNAGFCRADEAFTAPVPEGNGSPLGNAQHQLLDAVEHCGETTSREDTAL